MANLNALKALFQKLKPAAKTIANYGDDVARAVVNYGDDVAGAVANYGDDAASALTNYSDDVADVVARYGNKASIVDYGDGAELYRGFILPNRQRMYDHAIAHGAVPRKLDSLLKTPKYNRHLYTTYPELFQDDLPF